MANFSYTPNSSVTDCSYVKEASTSKAIKSSVYSAVILASVLGNVLVICVVYSSTRMRTVTNYLIVNMAASDLLTTVFNMIPTLYWLLRGLDVWHVGGVAGAALCKFLQFIQGVSVSVSVLTLVIIACDRFFAVHRPLAKNLKLLQALVLIALTWIVSIVILSPLLHVLKLVDRKGHLHCVEEWAPAFAPSASRHYTFALFALLYAGPLSLIATLYSIVIVQLWRRKTPGIEMISARENKDKQNKKVLCMLVTVVIVFSLSWLPLYVRMFLLFLRPAQFPCGLPYNLDFISLFFGHAHSAVNPFIYVIFSENYRRGFVGVFARGRCLILPIPGNKRSSTSTTRRKVVHRCAKENRRNQSIIIMETLWKGDVEL